MKKIWVMLVIAAQTNIRKEQTCYVVNEPLIQETDMFVKLVANILQKVQAYKSQICYKKVLNGTKTAKRRNGTVSKTKKTNILNVFNPKLL